MLFVIETIAIAATLAITLATSAAMEMIIMMMVLQMLLARFKGDSGYTVAIFAEVAVVIATDLWHCKWLWQSRGVVGGAKQLNVLEKITTHSGQYTSINTYIHMNIHTQIYTDVTSYIL